MVRTQQILKDSKYLGSSRIQLEVVFGRCDAEWAWSGFCRKKEEASNVFTLLTSLANDSNFDRNPLGGCNYGLEEGAFLILGGVQYFAKGRGAPS